MQMSIGVEYAFHSLFYMIDMPVGRTVGIRELAELNQLSETYLSKIFTKLRKAGIVRSVQGVKGGYELLKRAEDITFWDVVEAVEGSSYLFQCAEIRQKNTLTDLGELPVGGPCLIRTVMTDAEDQMRNYLKGKTLKWLYSEVYKDFSEEKKAAISNWVEKVSGQGNR